MAYCGLYRPQQLSQRTSSFVSRKPLARVRGSVSLFSPIDGVLGFFGNVISRRHEYAADAFAARTTGTPEALIDGLKRLTADILSNLTPHPLNVALNYRHPPVLQRISAWVIKVMHLAVRHTS